MKFREKIILRITLLDILFTIILYYILVTSIIDLDVVNPKTDPQIAVWKSPPRDLIGEKS